MPGAGNLWPATSLERGDRKGRSAAFFTGNQSCGARQPRLALATGHHQTRGNHEPTVPWVPYGNTRAFRYSAVRTTLVRAGGGEIPASSSRGNWPLIDPLGLSPDLIRSSDSRAPSRVERDPRSSEKSKTAHRNREKKRSTSAATRAVAHCCTSGPTAPCSADWARRIAAPRHRLHSVASKARPRCLKRCLLLDTASTADSAPWGACMWCKSASRALGARACPPRPSC